MGEKPCDACGADLGEEPWRFLQICYQIQINLIGVAFCGPCCAGPPMSNGWSRPAHRYDPSGLPREVCERIAARPERSHKAPNGGVYRLINEARAAERRQHPG